MKIQPPPLRCPCEGSHFSVAFEYDKPPDGEVRFRFSASGEYRREILRCGLCGHFVSRHQMEAGALYAGDYVSANYIDTDGIRRAFDRITALDGSKSDNAGRVRCILEFARRHFAEAASSRRRRSILDVGSGLCVFLHRMRAAGWDCTALDPDPRAASHASDTVGVRSLCGDFMAVEELGEFDVVTFNKVLEHVEDPVGMLAKAVENVTAEGFIYVEVPDGEAASAEGKHREEFFIDHPHVFSPTSLTLLAGRAGFALRSMERLREPSSKYTLRAFLQRPGHDGEEQPRDDFYR